MFEVITPGGPATTSGPGPEPVKPAQSAAANSGTVSIEEALKGTEHAKMNTFSVSDLSKGAGATGPDGKPIGGPAPGSTVALGGMVQGKLVVDLMDALLPAIIVLLFQRFGLAVRKSQMQLTQGEKNTLNPIVEACLNSVNLDFSNPWTALAVTLLLIYGSKALEVGGTGWLEKVAGEGRPYEPKKEKPVPAPIVNMVSGLGTRPPETKIETPNNNNTDFNPQGPTTWTESDVKAVVLKKKCSYAKAVEWLNKNWAKKGGVI